VTQRLLDVDTAGTYLGGVSAATIRALVGRGVLVPVRLPSTRSTSESNRRLLFDVNDLDALIDKWKRESTGAPNAGLSTAALKGWRNTPVRKNTTRGAARREGQAAGHSDAVRRDGI
jgi:hypothetical protein